MIMLTIMYYLILFNVIIFNFIINKEINEELKDLQKRVMWLQTEFGRKIFFIDVNKNNIVEEKIDMINPTSKNTIYIHTIKLNIEGKDIYLVLKYNNKADRGHIKQPITFC